MRPVAAAGVEAGFVDELAVRLDAPPSELRPAARAVLEDRPVVVDDTETAPGFVLWREAALKRGFRSCAAFPVRADGIVRGVLAVYAGEAGVFHDEVAALLAELAADLGYALHALETDERRAEAEQALRRSENSLKEAQRIAHVGSWDLDLERNILTWSDEIYRIFEIDHAQFGASYEAFLAAIYPDDRAFVDKAYTESVRTRTPYDIVHRLLMPDGRLKYVNERCETFYGEDGRPLRSLGTIQDISERKRAEMEIARVNRALQMLSDTNQALVRITDEATLLREVCRLVVDVGGYRMAWVGFVEHDEARTMRPVAHSGADAGYVESADVTWADDERGRGPGWTAVRTGQPCITRGVSTDTAFAPWREAAVKRGYRSILSLPLISEGQTLGAMLIYAGEEDAFDSNEVEILKELAGDLAFGITALRTRAKRDQAEEALHKREAELNESQRLAHIGSWDWDAVKDTIWWSAEYYRIYGLDSSQPTLNYVEHLSAYTAESARGLYAVVKRAMETGEPYEIDLELAHPSASTRWVVARGEVKRDAEGRILGLRGTAQNITERRRLEEETRRLNLELESRVEERTAALSEAVKELESFSYSVSHDLRAPLRAVDGFSSLLETQSAGSLDEEGRHLLQTIRRNAHQMGRLIDDLLRLSRSSRAELRMATIDMNGLVEEILDEMLPAAERDRTEIHVAKLPTARGDAGLVRVVLQNLLANALKYSAPRERRLIEIGVSPGDDGPEYFVRDNGVGFDPRYADRLFGVFQRLHSAAEFEGTGIGLALVKRIVSRHGGRVWAEGAVDRGATFWFTLGGAGSASGGV
ncbi:MAG: GAF domain-containing protein [Deltaproteobacteria bacterium]|nr:GAF domain-containing protein [Deltaproteobacteria bacterium]